MMKKYCVILDEELLTKAQDKAVKSGKVDPQTAYNTSRFLRALVDLCRRNLL